MFPVAFVCSAVVLFWSGSGSRVYGVSGVAVVLCCSGVVVCCGAVVVVCRIVVLFMRIARHHLTCLSVCCAVLKNPEPNARRSQRSSQSSEVEKCCLTTPATSGGGSHYKHGRQRRQ